MALWLEWKVHEKLEALLEESGHLWTLSLLYASKGLQQWALDIWRIIAQINLKIPLQGSPVMRKRGKESTGMTHDQLATVVEKTRFLEESSDHKLVLEHLTWVCHIIPITFIIIHWNLVGFVAFYVYSCGFVLRLFGLAVIVFHFWECFVFVFL